MSAVAVIGNSDDLNGIRWSPMLVLSAFLHLSIFSAIIFIPNSLPSGRVKGIVYEVNLVEMPAAGLNNQGTQAKVQNKGKTIPSKDTQAIRIPTTKKEEKPLVVAKRTIKKKSSQVKKPEVSSSQLIDKAISKIEKKVTTEKGDRIEKVIEKLEKKVGEGPPGQGVIGGRSLDGIPVRIYQMEVDTWIKSNWAYPTALQDQKKLEATVELKVNRDGTIITTKFIKRSKDAIFDQSVLKAIEKSNPLPPFPEGLRRKDEEFEINFNLKDLESD